MGSGSSFYSSSRSVPRRPWISPPANRLSVARATWRRRALVDTLADEHALFQRPGGEREGFGRRCPWLETLRTPECRQERPGGGAVACQGGLARCCEAGSAWRGAAVWAKARGAACRLGRGIVQYARSGRVQCMH